MIKAMNKEEKTELLKLVNKIKKRESYPQRLADRHQFIRNEIGMQ